MENKIIKIIADVCSIEDITNNLQIDLIENDLIKFSLQIPSSSSGNSGNSSSSRAENMVHFKVHFALFVQPHSAILVKRSIHFALKPMAKEKDLFATLQFQGFGAVVVSKNKVIHPF